MREAFTTVLELAGASLVAFGTWMAVPWLGVVVGGVALLAVGFLLSLQPQRVDA